MCHTKNRHTNLQHNGKNYYFVICFLIHPIKRKKHEPVALTWMVTVLVLREGLKNGIFIHNSENNNLIENSHEHFILAFSITITLGFHMSPYKN